MSIESLRVEDFSGREGERFGLRGPGGEALELRLDSVTRLGGRAPQATREPFSLLLHGPIEPRLPQRIYTLEIAGLGACDLFLVPVGADPEGIRYEVIVT